MATGEAASISEEILVSLLIHTCNGMKSQPNTIKTKHKFLSDPDCPDEECLGN
jgi:hypothetical protein